MIMTEYLNLQVFNMKYHFYKLGVVRCVIFYDLTEKVTICQLHVILVDWSGVSRWRRAVDTPGSLSTWKMLPLHPNMSLGLMCAKVCWDEGVDGVNLFLIMPLSWDFTLCGLIHAHEMSFQTSYTKPTLQDTEGDTVFSDTTVLLL